MSVEKSSDRYEIKTIDDLLRIPPDRLHDCLAELETSIKICQAMEALAKARAPTQEVTVELQSWTWIDDGRREQVLKYHNLSVELKPEEPDGKAN